MHRLFFYSSIIFGILSILSCVMFIFTLTLYEDNKYLSQTAVDDFCKNTICKDNFVYQEIAIFDCSRSNDIFKCDTYCNDDDYSIQLNVNYTDAINCLILQTNNGTYTEYTYFTQCNYAFNINDFLENGQVADTTLSIINIIILIFMVVFIAAFIFCLFIGCNMDN